MKFYHYPGCSTCRKASKWLEGRGASFEKIHIVSSPPSTAQIEDLWRRSGLPLKKFFNTSGQSYRQGGFKDRLGDMSDEAQIAALAADGKLIKRPVLDTGERVLVGFKEDDYAETV